MRYHWIGIGAGVVLITGLWVAYGAEKPRPSKEGRDGDTALLKHGEYLVNEVAHCVGCHSPQNGKGQPDQARLLQGTSLPIQPKKKTKGWMDESPDITRSGLAGEWNAADMIKFLMTGK